MGGYICFSPHKAVQPPPLPEVVLETIFAILDQNPFLLVGVQGPFHLLPRLRLIRLATLRYFGAGYVIVSGRGLRGDGFGSSGELKKRGSVVVMVLGIGGQEGKGRGGKTNGS